MRAEHGSAAAAASASSAAAPSAQQRPRTRPSSSLSSSSSSPPPLPPTPQMRRKRRHSLLVFTPSTKIRIVALSVAASVLLALCIRSMMAAIVPSSLLSSSEAGDKHSGQGGGGRIRVGSGGGNVGRRSEKVDDGVGADSQISVSRGVASGADGAMAEARGAGSGGVGGGTATSTDPLPLLYGKRILYTVASYEQPSIPYPMIYALRDVCEYGAKVDLVVYSTLAWPIDVIDDVNAVSQCRHPSGSVNVTVLLKSSEWRHSLVDFHRRLFYDNIDSYDLFVYTEDDHLIRPTNIVSYLDESERVKSIVGPDRFYDYAVGFIRFEEDRSVKEHLRRRLVFEHKWPKKRDDVESQLLLKGHDKLTGRYFTTPNTHHQGMFMALPDQLRHWKTRPPDCQFDVINEPPNSFLHKVRVSSTHLFRTDQKYGCNVTQLLPFDRFDDFLIHHLSDKYFGTSKYRPMVVTTSELRKRLFDAKETMMKTLAGAGAGAGAGEQQRQHDGGDEYRGVRMINSETEKMLVVNLDAYHEYVASTTA